MKKKKEVSYYKAVESLVFPIENGMAVLHISRGADITQRLYYCVVEDIFFRNFELLTRDNIKQKYGIVIPPEYRFETVFKKHYKLEKQYGKPKDDLEQI
jgi:hypothetical protein